MNKRILTLTFALMWGVLAIGLANWGTAETAAVPTAPAAVTDLRINEFMALNTGVITDPYTGSNADWIEIYNMGNTPVDLQGLYFSDTPAQPTKHQITQSLVIPAGGYEILWAINPVPPGAPPNYVGFALATNGESVVMVDTNGTTVLDSFTFGVQTANVSMARVPNGTGNFVFTSSPTPGGSNAVPPTISNVARNVQFPTAANTVQVTAVISDDGSIANATLHYSANAAAFQQVAMTHQGAGVYAGNIPALANGTVVSYYLSAQDNSALVTVSPAGAPANTYGYVVGYTRPTLVVNEFAARATPLENPDVLGNFPDWIEIYNYGTSTVSLNGLFLTDDTDKYAIPDGLSVPANGYIVFYADDKLAAGPLHTNFALGTNDAVGLYGANGFDPIDAFSYTGYTAAFINTTRGRLPDGMGNIAQLPTMTPGRSNQLLYNVSHAPAIPSDVQVVVVTAVIQDGMGTVNSATLWYSVDNGPLISSAMNKSGSTFTGVISPNSNGSVVRYHIEASYTTPVAFTSVGLLDEYGYVVGYTAPELYINEFMARNTATLSDTVGAFPDWIEIYNPTAAPISLAGLYLTDNSNNPTKFAITNTLSVPANGFIVFYADNVPVAISNTAEALLYTGFALSQTGEDVVLYGAEGFVLVDGVLDYGPQGENHSYGRTSDGNPIFQTFILNTPEYPSPLAPNDRRAPVIANVEHQPSFPNSTDTVTVTADVTDNGTLQTVMFYYRQEGAGVFTSTAMSVASGDTYQAVIPAYPDNTTIEYYLSAEDDNSNSATSPADAPTTVYDYTVYDVPPPTITNVEHTPLVPTSQESVTIRADITTTLALSQTTLFYRPQGGGAFTSVAMVLVSGNEYTADIPPQADGTTIVYYVRATDTNGSVATAPVNAPSTLYSYTVTDPPPSPPTITNVFHTPPTPTSSQLVVVQADIISTIGLSDTAVFYRLGSSGQFISVTLDPIGGDQFSATLPPQVDGSLVEYYVWALDDEGQETAAPANAPSTVYTYTVVDPTGPPPVIQNVAATPTNPNPLELVLVTADITATEGLSDKALFYRPEGEATFTQTDLEPAAGDSFEGTIPAFPEGTVVEFYLSASDTLNQSTVSPVGAPTAVYTYTVVELPPVPDLVINEFLVVNLNGIEDPNNPGERPAWLELHNTTAAPISLDGLYLTNDLDNPTLFPISAGLSVPANGYILFYLDGEPSQGNQHTNFTLSAAGGEIGLYSGSGGNIALDTHTFGAQGADISEGRYPNGQASFRKFRVPTPGAANVLNGPVISNPTLSPPAPGVGQTATIQATVTDDGQLVDVRLYYRINGGAYVSLEMAPQGNNLFRAQIPAQAMGTVVDYYLEATDNDDLLTTNPATPTTPFSYTVGEVINYAIYLPLVTR